MAGVDKIKIFYVLQFHRIGLTCGKCTLRYNHNAIHGCGVVVR